MINIATIGSCTPYDILKADPNFKSKYNVIFTYLGSISRTYYPPGKIALQVQKDPNLLRIKNLNLQNQLQLILKEKDLLSMIKSAPIDTVIIIDYAYELNRYFYDGSEMFDITSTYGRATPYMPDWLKNTIDSHNRYFDSGDIGIARRQYEYMQDFASQVASLPCIPIMFGDTFTSNVYIKELNQVGKILPLYTKKTFLARNKNFSDEMLAYQYSHKIIENFYKNISNGTPKNFERFDIDLDKVYSDSSHPNGPHPAHYHYSCRMALSAQLSDLIHKAVLKKAVPNIL
jgi:hypothetical protein